MSNTQQNLEDIYKLLQTLNLQEKIRFSQKLRADLSKERMAKLEVEESELSLEDIVKESKHIRQARFKK